jgi:hypothetical protein
MPLFVSLCLFIIYRRKGPTQKIKGESLDKLVSEVLQDKLMQDQELRDFLNDLQEEELGT